MGFFGLGFLLGHVVTSTVRKIVDHFQNTEEEDLTETDSSNTEESSAERYTALRNYLGKVGAPTGLNVVSSLPEAGQQNKEKEMDSQGTTNTLRVKCDTSDKLPERHLALRNYLGKVGTPQGLNIIECISVASEQKNEEKNDSQETSNTTPVECEVNERLDEEQVKMEDDLGEVVSSPVPNVVDSLPEASGRQDDGNATNPRDRSNAMKVDCERSPGFVQDHDLKLKSTASDSTANSDVDPTVGFCKFSNQFNNCWFNATMQAALNLKWVKEKLCPEKKEYFQDISQIQACSNLFLIGLYHPGKQFSSSSISIPLVEVSLLKAPLNLTKPKVIIEFAKELMMWLDKCGVQSALHVYNVTKCRFCKSVSNHSKALSCLCLLPPAEPRDGINSLFRRWIKDSCHKNTCAICHSKVPDEVGFNKPDVIVLIVPSATRARPKVDVLSSQYLYVPVEGGVQIYKLSAVICSIIVSADTSHYYTYVNLKDKIIKCDDSSVTVDDGSSEADIEKNGFIYFYENMSRKI